MSAISIEIGCKEDGAMQPPSGGEEKLVLLRRSVKKKGEYT